MVPIHDKHHSEQYCMLVLGSFPLQKQVSSKARKADGYCQSLRARATAHHMLDWKDTCHLRTLWKPISKHLGSAADWQQQAGGTDDTIVRSEPGQGAGAVSSVGRGVSLEPRSPKGKVTDGEKEQWLYIKEQPSLIFSAGLFLYSQS